MEQRIARNTREVKVKKVGPKKKDKWENSSLHCDFPYLYSTITVYYCSTILLLLLYYYLYIFIFIFITWVLLMWSNWHTVYVYRWNLKPHPSLLYYISAASSQNLIHYIYIYMHNNNSSHFWLPLVFLVLILKACLFLVLILQWKYTVKFTLSSFFFFLVFPPY